MRKTLLLYWPVATAAVLWPLKRSTSADGACAAVLHREYFVLNKLVVSGAG